MLFVFHQAQVKCRVWTEKLNFTIIAYIWPITGEISENQQIHPNCELGEKNGRKGFNGQLYGCVGGCCGCCNITGDQSIIEAASLISTTSSQTITTRLGTLSCLLSLFLVLFFFFFNSFFSFSLSLLFSLLLCLLIYLVGSSSQRNGYTRHYTERDS